MVSVNTSLTSPRCHSSRQPDARSRSVLVSAPAIAHAQQNSDSTRKTTLDPVTITATRVKTDVQHVAPAVTVLDTTAIQQRLPNTAADLLRELPGVDVIGTGVNQARPAIRGEQGQRVLLLEDGMRLNNAQTPAGLWRTSRAGRRVSDRSRRDRPRAVVRALWHGRDRRRDQSDYAGPAFGSGSSMSGRAGYEYSEQRRTRQDTGVCRRPAGKLGVRGRRLRPRGRRLHGPAGELRQRPPRERNQR